MPRKPLKKISPFRVVSVPDEFSSPCRKCEDKNSLICLDPNTCLKIRAYRDKTEGVVSDLPATNLYEAYDLVA